MPGEHNRLNAALGYEALKAVSLSDEEIFTGLASFQGVPGRLEYLGENNGVKIYNDNNATTPQATIKGLQAVGDSASKNVILIAGGADKGIGREDLLVEISKYCKQVMLLPGTGTDIIKKELEAIEVDNIEEAVQGGLAVGLPGDVLLFSPGFASFGLFKNEYERNDAFVTCVNKITD
jgi:UDP-N-acetylmuramoylalanine--D-glutamate ligase